MIRSASSLLVLLLATASASAEPAFVQTHGVWHRSPDGCGTPQVALANPDARATPPATGTRTVFLNRFGGTYQLGSVTNAATNTASSQIIPGNGSPTFTIAPMDASTFNWTNISACVRNHFKPFDIRVVETEPTSGTYVEAVVGGDGTEIGFPPDQLFGIASADNFCNVTETGIAFSFSETHRQVPRRDEELCATIAHEVGHLLALEHEQLPTDVMSYVLVNDAGSKAFVDQTSGCGTSPQDVSNCTCSASSTNSHARLAQFIGLKNVETVPPTLAVDSPGDALELSPVFDVVATATDDVEMSDVVALIDGNEVGNDFEPEGSTYRISVVGAPEGSHTLTVIAHDAAGNMAQVDRSITVRRLATGEACTQNEVCSGGLCAQAGEDQFCTQTCTEAASCPDGFDCVDAGGTQICAPGADGGGCCSTSADPRAALLLGLAVGLVLVRRRKR